MDKQEFIGKYLDEKMKNHGLPYGMAYLNLLAETEEKAEKAYLVYIKKQEKNNTQTGINKER